MWWEDLGSGLIDPIQKITAAAILIADMKVWGGTQPQFIFNDEDDAAYNHAVIYSRNPMRERKIKLNAAHLRFAQKK